MSFITVLIHVVSSQSNLADSVKFDTLFVLLATSDEEFPVKGFGICLLRVIEHHDGPNSPVKVVQHHALLDLLDGAGAVRIVKVPRQT